METVEFSVIEECEYVGSRMLDVVCDYHIERVDNGVGGISHDLVVDYKGLEIYFEKKEITNKIIGNGEIAFFHKQAFKKCLEHNDNNQ